MLAFKSLVSGLYFIVVCSFGIHCQRYLENDSNVVYVTRAPPTPPPTPVPKEPLIRRTTPPVLIEQKIKPVAAQSTGGVAGKNINTHIEDNSHVPTAQSAPNDAATNVAHSQRNDFPITGLGPVAMESRNVVAIRKRPMTTTPRNVFKTIPIYTRPPTVPTPAPLSNLDYAVNHLAIAQTNPPVIKHVAKVIEAKTHKPVELTTLISPVIINPPQDKPITGPPEPRPTLITTRIPTPQTPHIGKSGGSGSGVSGGESGGEGVSPTAAGGEGGAETAGVVVGEGGGGEAVVGAAGEGTGGGGEATGVDVGEGGGGGGTPIAGKGAACTGSHECETGCCYDAKGKFLDSDNYGPGAPLEGTAQGTCRVYSPGLGQACDDFCPCNIANDLTCYRRYRPNYKLAAMPGYEAPEDPVLPSRMCFNETTVVAERESFWNCYYDPVCSGPAP